jgi:hypothetical protein
VRFILTKYGGTDDIGSVVRGEVGE